jgi:hypothetical protein
MELGIRCAVPCLALLVSVLPAAAQGVPGRPGRFNPPHLAEMPLVERVLRDITAPDPRDAAARQMGAFEQLNEIIEELSGGRTAIGQATPDEVRIMGEYRQARYEVQQRLVRTPQDEALLPALRRFDEDPALRVELVKRFLSPALGAQSTAISQQLQARRAAMRQRQAANGGIPDAFGGSAARPAAPAPAAAPVPAAGNARSAAGVAAQDPSIARARAAKVDTGVFGMQLGEPLTLPRCAGGLLSALTAPAATCVSGDDVLGIAAAALTALAGNQGEMVIISLAKENCPAWLSNCAAYGHIEGGRLMGVTMRPDGPQVEQAVGKELVGKYGRWATATEHFITNNVTGARFTVLDLRWILPGLHVEYVPASAEDITKGSIRIETDPVYQRRQEAVKEATKPKL